MSGRRFQTTPPELPPDRRAALARAVHKRKQSRLADDSTRQFIEGERKREEATKRARVEHTRGEISKCDESIAQLKDKKHHLFLLLRRVLREDASRRKSSQAAAKDQPSPATAPSPSPSLLPVVAAPSPAPSSSPLLTSHPQQHAQQHTHAPVRLPKHPLLSSHALAHHRQAPVPRARAGSNPPSAGLRQGPQTSPRAPLPHPPPPTTPPPSRPLPAYGARSPHPVASPSSPPSSLPPLPPRSAPLPASSRRPIHPHYPARGMAQGAPSHRPLHVPHLANGSFRLAGAHHLQRPMMSPNHVTAAHTNNSSSLLPHLQQQPPANHDPSPAK